MNNILTDNLRDKNNSSPALVLNSGKTGLIKLYEMEKEEEEVKPP